MDRFIRVLPITSSFRLGATAEELAGPIPQETRRRSSTESGSGLGSSHTRSTHGPHSEAPRSLSPHRRGPTKPAWAVPGLFDARDWSTARPSKDAVVEPDAETIARTVEESSQLADRLRFGTGEDVAFPTRAAAAPAAASTSTITSFFCFTYGPIRSGKTTLLLGADCAALGDERDRAASRRPSRAATAGSHSSEFIQSPLAPDGSTSDGLSLCARELFRATHSGVEDDGVSVPSSSVFARFLNAFFQGREGAGPGLITPFHDTSTPPLEVAVVELFCGQWCDLLGRELHNIGSVSEATFLPVHSPAMAMYAVASAQSKREEVGRPALPFSISTLVLVVRVTCETEEGDGGVGPAGGRAGPRAYRVGYFVDLPGCDDVEPVASVYHLSVEEGRFLTNNLKQLRVRLLTKFLGELGGRDGAAVHDSGSAGEAVAVATNAGVPSRFLSPRLTRWTEFLTDALAGAPRLLGLFTLRGDPQRDEASRATLRFSVVLPLAPRVRLSFSEQARLLARRRSAAEAAHRSAQHRRRSSDAARHASQGRSADLASRAYEPLPWEKRPSTFPSLLSAGQGGAGASSEIPALPPIGRKGSSAGGTATTSHALHAYPPSIDPHGHEAPAASPETAPTPSPAARSPLSPGDRRLSQRITAATAPTQARRASGKSAARPRAPSGVAVQLFPMSRAVEGLFTSRLAVLMDGEAHDRAFIISSEAQSRQLLLMRAELVGWVSGGAPGEGRGSRRPSRHPSIAAAAAATGGGPLSPGGPSSAASPVSSSSYRRSTASSRHRSSATARGEGVGLPRPGSTARTAASPRRSPSTASTTTTTTGGAASPATRRSLTPRKPALPKNPASPPFARESRASPVHGSGRKPPRGGSGRALSPRALARPSTDVASPVAKTAAVTAAAAATAVVVEKGEEVGAGSSRVQETPLMPPSVELADAAARESYAAAAAGDPGALEPLPGVRSPLRLRSCFSSQRQPGEQRSGGTHVHVMDSTGAAVNGGSAHQLYPPLDPFAEVRTMLSPGTSPSMRSGRSRLSVESIESPFHPTSSGRSHRASSIAARGHRMSLAASLPHLQRYSLRVLAADIGASVSFSTAVLQSPSPLSAAGMRRISSTRSSLPAEERLYPLVQLFHADERAQQALMGEELFQRNDIELQERRARRWKETSFTDQRSALAGLRARRGSQRSPRSQNSQLSSSADSGEKLGESARNFAPRASRVFLFLDK